MDFLNIEALELNFFSENDYTVDSNTVLFTIQLDKMYRQKYVLLPTDKNLFLQGYKLSLNEKPKQSHNF